MFAKTLTALAALTAATAVLGSPARAEDKSATSIVDELDPARKACADALASSDRCPPALNTHQ